MNKNNQSHSAQSLTGLDIDRRRLLGATGAVLAALATRQTLAQPPATGAALDAVHFPGFRSQWLEVNGAGIHTLVGGEGPPVLLLHGAPQSHLSWAQVAVTLAQTHTVIATDLRGYGWSSKPEGGENHINYSKRTMAQDQVDVMQALGHERFHLVGHDRGGRVARRLAIDHPQRVRTLTVLDIVPAHYLYANVTRQFVDAYFHWFLFIRPAPFPENIMASTGMFIGGGPGDIGASWAEVYKDPGAIHAMCEDYRASAGMDLAIDAADLEAGKRIECPLNVLWGDNAAMGRQYDVLGIWQMEATRAEGKSMPGGHSFQMDSPAETATELLRFFAANA